MNQGPHAQSPPIVSPDGQWRWDGAQWVPNLMPPTQPDPGQAFETKDGSSTARSAARVATRKRPTWLWLAIGAGILAPLVGYVAGMSTDAVGSNSGATSAGSPDGFSVDGCIVSEAINLRLPTVGVQPLISNHTDEYVTFVVDVEVTQNGERVDSGSKEYFAYPNSVVDGVQYTGNVMFELRGAYDVNEYPPTCNVTDWRVVD